MKIENIDNKLILYLYNKYLSIDNINKLNQEIKEICLNLMKKHHFHLFGYYLVDIYYHHKYGSILEIKNIYDELFPVDIIDLKVIVHKNNNFYLEMDDVFIINDKIFFKQDKFYININDIDNINKYIEFGKIKYL